MDPIDVERSGQASAKGGEVVEQDGDILARTGLTGADGCTFTANLMAWMADMIRQGKLQSAGAVGRPYRPLGSKH